MAFRRKREKLEKLELLAARVVDEEIAAIHDAEETCPGCKAAVAFPVSHSGGKVECPACGHVFTTEAKPGDDEQDYLIDAAIHEALVAPGVTAAAR